MKIDRRIIPALFLVMISAFSVKAAELTIRSGDSIQKLLEEQKGKRVTVRLQGNDELTGTVRIVTRELLHLGELSGRSYFDAVIDLNKVSAIIIRIKE